MRTIKFRGKEVDTGKWMYGDLFQRTGFYPSIITSYIKDDGKIGYVENAVIQDTIGQFTGLCDRHGTEIYEGDIITHLQHRIDGVGVLYEGHVEWRQEEGCYVFVDKIKTKDGRDAVRRLISCNDIRIIGNIHENPEFMEGGQK
jgi:uncharacterized phage protein (TIGR01671 family)